MNVTKYIIQFINHSAFKRFLWNTFNGFIGVLIVYLTDIGWEYAPIVIAILNGITKELNNKYGKKGE